MRKAILTDSAVQCINKVKFRNTTFMEMIQQIPHSYTDAVKIP